VRRLCQKESKLVLALSSVESKLNFPPKTCMPSRAKMTMNRKSRRRRDAIDWMELRSDATKLESDRQYLHNGNEWRKPLWIIYIMKQIYINQE